MGNKFIRFDNVALVMGIDTLHINKIHQHVLIFLASHSHADGTSIFVSHKMLSEEMGYSTKSISRTINFLVDKKFLLVTHKWKKGCHKPVVYKLNIELIKSAQKHSVDNLSVDRKYLDKTSVDSLSIDLPPECPLSLDRMSIDLPPECPPKKVLNIKTTTNAAAAALVEKLISEGFLEKEASQQLLEYDTERINRNYLAFTARKSKINNPVAWLKDAFKNDWAKSNLNALESPQGEYPPLPPNPKPKTPTIEELTAYWLRSAPEKRQIIYDEAKVVFTYLDYQLYGADPLSDEFVEHHAFLSMWGALHKTEYRKPKSNGILPSTLEPL